MAIQFFTSNPSGLLAAFKKAIDQGHIVTWSYDSVSDFTHTPSQWVNKAWLRPNLLSDRLQFNIVRPEGKTVSWEVFAVYQGRFIESMTLHLHDSFSLATATSRPTTEDDIGHKR